MMASEPTSAPALDKAVNDMLVEASRRELAQPSEHDEIREAIAAEMSRRESVKKPNIDRLVDAVVHLEDGTPVFVPDIGEKVIIERHSNILPGWGWLDTRVYIVRFIDHDTGHLRLWDPEAQHFALSNFIEGPKRGYRFKLPPVNGRLESPGKRRRRRSAAEKAAEGEAAPQPKKRRGRPAGVKNRPKDVIAAEKADKAKSKAEKAAKRDVKKRRQLAVTSTPVTPSTKTAAKKKRPKGKATKKSRSRRIKTS